MAASSKLQAAACSLWPAAKNRRGVSVFEYVVLLAIMIAALIGMQRMMRAHVSGAWRDALDQFGHGHQYEKGRTAAPPPAHQSRVSWESFR